jgi:hypothetical protein
MRKVYPIHQANGYIHKAHGLSQLKWRKIMSDNVKASTVAGSVGAIATAGTAASTASAVVGGSAATIMSATAGTTGAALASVAGASGTAGAAAISSGMAAIGSAVGSGMAAGAIMTAAAPVAVVAAIAYGLFKLFED